MESLTNRKKVIEQEPLTLWEKAYFPVIAKGLMITVKHLFKRSATIKYPEQTRPFAKVYRGLHVLKRDEQGRENCTACGLCAVACPAEAITMTAAERKKGEEHLYREEKYASVYEIDMLRCIFCGLCEEACPKDAIYLTDRIVVTEYERSSFIYGKDKLVEPIDQRVDVSERKIKSEQFIPIKPN